MQTTEQNDTAAAEQIRRDNIATALHEIWKRTQRITEAHGHSLKSREARRTDRRLQHNSGLLDGLHIAIGHLEHHDGPTPAMKAIFAIEQKANEPHHSEHTIEGYRAAITTLVAEAFQEGQLAHEAALINTL